MDISDPATSMLASIAANLESDYEVENDTWDSSSFGWIKSKPSGQIGKIGVRLMSAWCTAYGLDVTGCEDSEADRIINGHRVEIKFSTLWKSGIYKFQQIRDQNYEYLICLGISPFNAHCWVFPKGVLMDHVIGHTPQHRGREGTDTYWLTIQPDEPDPWLNDFGGSMEKALIILKSIKKRK